MLNFRMRAEPASTRRTLATTPDNVSSAVLIESPWPTPIAWE